MNTVLIFCAHSDDEAIGVGGTIAKYVAEKKDVIKVVFSHGEKSIPHLQEEVVKKARLQETDAASAFIGIKETICLGLKDTKLKSEVQQPTVIRRVKKLILQYKPEKIYVPSALDPHPDHQAVNGVVLQIVDSLSKHYPVYAYEVWNVVKETHPRVYVDVSLYMKKKLTYIRMFKSQWGYMFLLYLPTLFRSIVYGRKNGCTYAERFYKIR
ncbi:MAG TPA: PIG-L family deacetylase [Candidatus Nanoarchaeia archaeon]|nr:PIG-L family deacetylase [Candidatus Nanoarchaeia archaeon]